MLFFFVTGFVLLMGLSSYLIDGIAGVCRVAVLFTVGYYLRYLNVILNAFINSFRILFSYTVFLRNWAPEGFSVWSWRYLNMNLDPQTGEPLTINYIEQIAKEEEKIWRHIFETTVYTPKQLATRYARKAADS